MAKTCVGIDIGASALKLAVCSDGVPRRLVVEDMPENLVKEGHIVSHDAMAEFMKKTVSKAKINTRHCAVILPSSVAFTRTMTLPVMSREHLKINLPYEFRDFITQEKDKYFYDYAVTDTLSGEDGEVQELELIAAVALKETVGEYSNMCRRAGMKLVTAIPEELSYMNIVRRYEEKSTGGSAEYCFIDIGHTATRLHIYSGIKHQASRVVDYGVQMLDTVIAEDRGVDEYTARAYKHANTNNELMSAECRNIYSMISIEVVRAINFYRFNNPDSNLSEVFLCGGGSRIEPLVIQIAADIGLPIRSVEDLLPANGGSENAAVCPAAIGAAMQ